jgi:predicted AlkP superfamily phosphohydrolase/phosphomutase
MPISHPPLFANYLARLQGPYATLGLAEDTWGLNERALDEGAFLDQVWSIHAEREAMFFRVLETTSRGCVACVFDVTDRIQHMFMRYRDPAHPANRDKDTEKYAAAIDELYERMDGLLGRALAKKRPQDVLFVMSDHGFTLFKRGMNLNSWLWKNGYLATKDNQPSAELFASVDWERTRAYALGLSGIFLNLRGREREGVVDPEAAPALRAEIAGKLSAEMDGEARAIARVYRVDEVFKGPYLNEAPDLVVGFRPGWRVSWDGAMGVVNETIFEDNVKGWSGDHCVDQSFVPGVLFCDRPLSADDPWIGDLAPTILKIFGVPIPPHVDGKPLIGDSLAPARTKESA